MLTRLACVLVALLFVLGVTMNSAYAQDSHYIFYDSNSNYNIGYDWIGICDPSEPNYVGLGATDPLLTEDDDYITVPLPFVFKYFGVPQTMAYITTNGVISFAEPVKSDWYSNEEFPNSNLPYAIAPFWDDLLPLYEDIYTDDDDYYSEGNGVVRYMTYGTAPNRMFIVEWYDIAHYSNEDDRYNFELVLFEGKDDILFLYRNMTGEYASGDSATIGLNAFSDSPYFQYSYEMDVIPTDTSTVFKILFTTPSHSWQTLDSPEDHNADLTFCDSRMPTAMTPARDFIQFAAYAEPYSNNIVVEMYNGAWTQLPSLLNDAFGGEMPPLYIENLYLLNAGQGHCYIFVRGSYMYGAVKPDGKIDRGLPNMFLISAYFNGEDWEPLTSSFLDMSWLAGYQLTGFSVALNPLTNMPYVAVSLYSYAYESLPTVDVYGYNGTEWDSIGTDMSVTSVILNYIGDRMGGQLTKVDNVTYYGSYEIKNPIIQFTQSGKLYLACTFGYDDMCCFSYSNALFVLSANTWDFVLVDSEPFVNSIGSWQCKPELFIGPYILYGWWETDGEGYGHPVIYAFSENVASLEDLHHLAHDYSYPQYDNGFVDYNYYLGYKIELAIDFAGRPLFCYPSTGDEEEMLSFVVYRATGLNSNWSPLDLDANLGGLVPNYDLVSSFDMELDQCGNPSVFLYKYRWDSYIGAIDFRHYVIDMWFTVNDQITEIGFIKHANGVSTSNFTFAVNFSEPGLSGNYSGNLSFLSGISGGCDGGIANTITINTGNYQPGSYNSELMVDAPFVYHMANLTVFLVKYGPPTLLRVPVDYPTIYDALVASRPGNIIFLANGEYTEPGDLPVNPDGITIRGESIDGTVITDLEDIVGPTYISFENLTFNFTEQSPHELTFGFEYIPGEMHFKNVVIKAQGRTVNFVGHGTVTMDYVTLFCKGTYYNYDKIDNPIMSYPASLVVQGPSLDVNHSILSVLNIISFPGTTHLVYSAIGDANLEGIIVIDSAVDYSESDWAFVNEAEGDLHLSSKFGHYDYASNSFIVDEYHSALIDAGDIFLGAGLETLPNGFIANLGAYGMTPWASKSMGTPSEYNISLMGGKTVDAYRMICIPFTPQLSLNEFWPQLLAPFGGIYNREHIRIFTYNPTLMQYREYPNLGPWFPGMGLWIISDTDITIHLSGFILSDNRILIPVKSGWNMVGFPMPNSTYISDLYVVLSDGSLVPFLGQYVSEKPDMTTGQGAVATDVFVYNYSTKSYDLIDYNAPLVDGTAYWFYAFYDTQLYYMPSNGKSNKFDAATISAPSGPPAPPGLTLSVTATGGGGGCFVATAAFGTLSSDAVAALTSARDNTIRDSLTTSSMVDLYYSVSPSAAGRLSQSDSARAFIRRLLQ